MWSNGITASHYTTESQISFLKQHAMVIILSNKIPFTEFLILYLIFTSSLHETAPDKSLIKWTDYSHISAASSEPSGQSFSPSQRQPLEMHVTPSLHTNCLGLQVFGAGNTKCRPSDVKDSCALKIWTPTYTTRHTYKEGGGRTYQQSLSSKSAFIYEHD